MKAIFLSIKPEHALNILDGRKTLELRTRIPKEIMLQIKNKEIEGIWVYGYVTKGYPLLNHIDNKYKLMDRKNHTIFHNIGMYEFYNDDIHLNGTIPFRFWFDEYDEVLTQRHIDSEQIERVLKQACIEHDDLDKYVGDKETIYAWHIKKLEIFDKPKVLSEFYKDYDTMDTDSNGNYIGWYEIGINPLQRPPQSWQYVWVKE